MIPVEELMIGNLILGIYEDDDDNESAEIVKVVCIDPTKEITDYEIWVDGKMDQYDDFAPIPLTEEWLIKFGFNRIGKDFVINGIIIHARKRGYSLRKSVPDIKNVHSLQNLMFALTNKELTLK